MKKKLTTWIVFGAAAATMGIAMPSCPGQQAMQQQIDQLQAGHTETMRRYQTLDNEIRQLAGEIAQIKQAINSFTGPAAQQEQRLNTLEAAVKDIQTRMAQKMAAPPAKKKKH